MSNDESSPIKPAHYQPVDESCDIHCHHAQLAQMGHEMMIGYHWGNIIKYIWRWQRKNGLEDLKKAGRHIEMLIELEEKKGKVHYDGESQGTDGGIDPQCDSSR